MNDTEQLRHWQGNFGDEYTQRNILAWETRLPGFQKMLAGLSLKKILEVGCNRGHNLVTLCKIFQEANAYGIEPNANALMIAKKLGPRTCVLRGDVFNIPFNDGYFDLVFTAGVLIHVNLADLAAAMREIDRVSSRYILAVEYFAEQETRVTYRGRDDLLWKRDFLKHYLDTLPHLSLVNKGHWRRGEHGMDESDWWLLEKSS